MKRILLLLALCFQLLAPSSFATYQPTTTVSSSALPTGAATSANQVSGGPQTGSGVVTGTTQRVTLATDGPAVTNIAAIAANTPAVATAIPLDNAPAQPVRQVPADMWRCSFAGSGAGLITTDLTLLATGSGQAVSQLNGSLVITTGTTANSETLIRSNRTFTSAMIARTRVQLSQRIVNQSFGIWLADLVGSGLAYTTNGDGSQITVTIPSNPFTSANIGQSMNLGAISGTGAPGRYAITAVSGNNVTFSAIFSATWTRSTTTATVTLTGGGGQEIIIGQTGTVTNTSDASAIVNGAVTVVGGTGTTFTFTCLNAGATSGTLTYQNTAQTFAASASGTLTLWGWNAIRAIARDTSATIVSFDTQRNGWGFIDSNSTVNTTATGPVLQFQSDNSTVDLSDSAVASNTSYQFTSRATRIENIPDDNVPLYLFISSRNLTSVPASTTMLTVGFTGVEVVGNLKVHLAGATQNGAARALPVQLQGGITAVTTASTGIATMGNAAAGSTAGNNPVQIGVVAATAIQTARTAGQMAAVAGDKIGRIVGANEQIRDLTQMAPMVTLTSTTETTIVAATTAIFNDLRAVIITNTSATAVRVDFRTVAAGAVVFSWMAEAGKSDVVPLPVAAKQATVNTAWTAQLSAAVTDVRITAFSIAVN